MSSLGVSTTVEQEHRRSSLIFRVVTRRRLGGLSLQVRRAELEATPEGLTSVGDLGGYKPGALHLPWERIRELHFAPSGAGEIGGLYAREGAICSRCILPRLSESQAGELIGALIARFPFLIRTSHMSHDSLPAYLPSPAPPQQATSLNLLPQKPTPQLNSLSHALNRAAQTITGREHESARRIHRGTAGSL